MVGSLVAGRCRLQLRGNDTAAAAALLVVLGALLAADSGAECVAEVLRRPVVDDRVDARVEVGEPGAQHVDGVDGVAVVRRRRTVEEDEQQEYVYRQPEQREHDHDQNQQAPDLALAVRRTRLFLSHATRNDTPEINWKECALSGDANRHRRSNPNTNPNPNPNPSHALKCNVK